MGLELGAIFGPELLHHPRVVALDPIEDGLVPGQNLRVRVGIAIEPREHALQGVEGFVAGGTGRAWPPALEGGR